MNFLKIVVFLSSIESQVKAELQKVGDMRPGSINTQMTVCGRKGCRCQDKTNPQKHGPYYQLSYVHQGKSSTQFIQKPLKFSPTIPLILHHLML